jgi:adenosylmethionine-8-amino-7-oxononanoate aminotransferase
VALASLDLFREEGTLARVAALEGTLRAGLEPLRRLANVGDVRVIGGVGLVEMRSDAPGYLNEFGSRVSRALLDRGLLLRPLGNVVYFMPPYAITREEAEWAIGQIAEVLEGATALPGA